MTNRPESGPPSLILELIRHALHRDILTYAEMKPLLQQLLPASTAAEHSPYVLFCLLQENGNAEARTLAQRIHVFILKDAVKVALLRKVNPTHAWDTVPTLAHLPPTLPAGWRNDDQLLPLLKAQALRERDRAFLVAVAPELAGPIRAVTEACTTQRELLRPQSLCSRLFSPAQVWSGFVPPPGTELPPHAMIDSRAEQEARLAELAQLALTAPAPAGAAALQQLLAWPDATFAASILKACVTPITQAYAMHALALRTGFQYNHWWEWDSWLKRTEAATIQLRASLAKLADEYGPELRLIWLYEQNEPVDPALIAAVSAEVSARASQNTTAADYIRRWDHVLTPAEYSRISGGAVAVPAPLAAEPPLLPQAIPPILPPARAPAPASATPARPPEILERKAAAPLVEKSTPPIEPPTPSVWDEHFRPFLAANWYIIAGLSLVLAGASLLAYFTWDKSVFVRYFFLPVLMAGFTGGLAELGLRLSRRHEHLRSSGTFLIGGAICLLPVNFMVLCRAGDDPNAGALVLSALGLYTALAGVGLWRWCGAVLRELSLLLGVPLLAVNLLAVLGDMPGMHAATEGHRAMLVPATITGAVLLLLTVSNRFLRLVLTKDLLESKLVPWFFGITMTVTTAQVAVWRHFHLGLTPHPKDYALAAILVGATLLRWERRACELRNTGAAYGGESFLGYATLLLGILMGAGQEWLRIVTLLLAGLIWLVQAPRRPGIVHYWIGATLCLLSGAAIGMLEAFPKSGTLNLLPALGLGLALVAGATRALAGRFNEVRLRTVALEIQPPILLVTAIVAVLSQYHFHSAPAQAGLVLIAVASFFAFRATKENRPDWLNIAAACAGLALPYLGCADMLRYRFSDNTLALGFGLLAAAWLGAAQLLRGEIWRRSASITATWFGGVGIFGLFLRLVLSHHLPMLGMGDLAGGLLLAGTLGVVVWQSRKLVPGLMAAGLLVVLLPLFTLPAGAVPLWLEVGTGLPSATVALALMLGCFALRSRNAGLPATADPKTVTGEPTALSSFIIPVLAAMFWLSGKALLLQMQSHPDQSPFIASALFISATFYAGAIFFRIKPIGRVLFHASWLLLGTAITLACDAAHCSRVEMFQYPLLWTGLALTALTAAEWAAARKWEWVRAFLVRPHLALLADSSAYIGVLILVAIQVHAHDYRDQLQWLTFFFSAQLIWHGMRTTQRRFGGVLFLLATSWLCVGRGLPGDMGSLPIFVLLVLLADSALEFLPQLRLLVNPLRAPLVAGSSVLAPALALLAIFSIHRDAMGALDFASARLELGMILGALLVAARTQLCAGFVLPAAMLGYLFYWLPCSSDELFRPWRLAEFALMLGLVPFLGGEVLARWPRVLLGTKPQLPHSASTSQAPWLVAPGLVLVVFAAILQVALSATDGGIESRWTQIFAPFAAVAAFLLAGIYWRRGSLWMVAACLLPLANLFAISVLWGRDLLDAQLSSLHISGIAAVLTIAEFTAARWWLRARSGSDATSLAVVSAQRLHYGSAALAGLTLVLLGVNYLVHPDLAQIPTVRFIASGLLSLCAGTYFRFAARRPENLRTQNGTTMEALWHVALGQTLWCGALLIQALRTPHAALYALALPAAACWFAAEWFLRIKQKSEEHDLIGTRFRVSATSFALLILVLYVFRLPFQLLLFPNAPLGLDQYHTGATAAMAMGLILIRLRGLGGAPWSALVGGLALMTGLYFNATWLPGLSPFDFPMAGAWATVVAAHLLILLSFQQSPLRSLIQHIGGIGAEEWHEHRRSWGVFLTGAVHVAVLAGLVQDYDTHSRETTPLLIALATVLIHQLVIGAPWIRTYGAIAAGEILLALHLDFFLPAEAPGLIPAKSVVWFFLVPWLGATLFWHRLKERVTVATMWTLASALAVLAVGHLLYHGPATDTGLLIAGLMILAALTTPLPENESIAHKIATVLLVAPLWLAYFGTRYFTDEGALGFHSWLAGAAALLGSGMLARFAGGVELPLTPPRLAHEVVALCRRAGDYVARVLLGGAFAALVLLTFLHPDARNGALGLMLALSFVWGVSCVAWFREGQLRDGVLPYTLSTLSLAGAWILLRRLLFQHFSFWTYEYDIWLSLGASIAFSAAKRLIKHEHPGLARTMTGTVWLLPVLQCVWLLSNRMSEDLTLLVIGIQSMLFAWHGGGKRDSAYNGVSMLGFVGFICLLFWAKLDLRMVQAYTIPCGLGVLGLVWLFGQHMLPAFRNAVRLVTVLAMLGSCGYYALLDNTYPVGFHLTMILLCLGVMALGPVLRVQLYLYLGFAGFATDLVALVVKQFRVLDRSTQMVGVGALLLLLGIVVVGGAILYKTQHEAISARLGKIRARLGGWE